MPVMRVQHLRLRRNLRERRERGETEEGEAPGVVRVVRAVVAVDARPVEEVGMLDKEHLRTSGGGGGAVEPGVLNVPTERDSQRLPRALQGRRGLAHQLVQRHDDWSGM